MFILICVNDSGEVVTYLSYPKFYNLVILFVGTKDLGTNFDFDSKRVVSKLLMILKYKKGIFVYNYWGY